MKFSIPFQGTQENGIAKLKTLLDQHRAEAKEKVSGVKEQWNGDVLSFAFDAEGKHIEGTVTVQDGAYDVYVRLPLALRLFEGTIERMIEAEAKKYLAK